MGCLGTPGHVRQEQLSCPRPYSPQQENHKIKLYQLFIGEAHDCATSAWASAAVPKHLPLLLHLFQFVSPNTDVHLLKVHLH